jgi:plastocyanin
LSGTLFRNVDSGAMPSLRPTSTPVAHALAVTLVAVLVALVPAACSDSGGGSASGQVDGLPDVPAKDYQDLTGKKTVTVDAVDNAFQPQYIKVSKGTKVEFTNTGQNPHNVFAADQGAFTDVPVDQFGPGATADVTLDDAGTFPYYCSLHGTAKRGMNGRIIVVG